MNENLQSALVEILNKAMSGIDASVAFMEAELPDVINQLLTWYAVKSGFQSVFSLLSVLVCVFLWIKWFKKCSKDPHSDVIEMFVLPSMFIAPVALVAGSAFNLEWLQIWIAPKIWLMEYAAELVK